MSLKIYNMPRENIESHQQRHLTIELYVGVCCILLTCLFLCAACFFIHANGFYVSTQLLNGGTIEWKGESEREQWRRQTAKLNKINGHQQNCLADGSQKKKNTHTQRRRQIHTSCITYKCKYNSAWCGVQCRRWSPNVGMSRCKKKKQKQKAKGWLALTAEAVAATTTQKLVKLWTMCMCVCQLGALRGPV